MSLDTRPDLKIVTLSMQHSNGSALEVNRVLYFGRCLGIALCTVDA
jgi:hypothetical protein